MFLSLSLVQLLVQLPMLAVLVVGFGMLSARRRRLPARTVTLGYAGCAVLLLVTLVSGAWAAMLPRLLADADLSSSVWGVLTFVVGMVQGVLYAGGIGLLLAALLARTGPGGSAPSDSGGALPHGHPGGAAHLHGDPARSAGPAAAVGGPPPPAAWPGNTPGGAPPTGTWPGNTPGGPPPPPPPGPNPG